MRLWPHVEYYTAAHLMVIQAESAMIALQSTWMAEHHLPVPATDCERDSAMRWCVVHCTGSVT